MSGHVLVRGGIVFDGATPAGAPVDVRMRGGKIVQLGAGLAPDGATGVDAAGAWVTPGFVDAHSHCDLAVLSGHEMEGRARAGVTTEIVGQDGLGFAPARGPVAEAMMDVLAPITGETAPLEWESTGDYLSTVDAGAYARVATLVPHGAIRAAVLGREPRAASPAERIAMAGIVAEEMAHAACGVSTGLSYPPALWSDTDELVEVAAAMPPGTGRYVTHLRDYGRGFEESLDEAFEIGRRSARPVHLSHLHISGPGRSGAAPRYLAMAEAAAETGVAISWDSYPYTIACTFLTTVLPHDLQELSGDALTAHLASEERAAALARRLDQLGPGPTVAAGWTDVLLSGLRSTAVAGWDGRSVAAIAKERGMTSGQIVVDVMREVRGKACILVAQGHRDNVLAISAASRQVVGSDGIPGSGVPHPRATGTFLRYLRWARDGVVEVSVAEMVSRMTARSARLFGLPVGVIRVGAPADLLIIDPNALEDGPDTGAFAPRAIRHSFLGGEPVIADGGWLAPRQTGLALRSRGAQ